MSISDMKNEETQKVIDLSVSINRSAQSVLSYGASLQKEIADLQELGTYQSKASEDEKKYYQALLEIAASAVSFLAPKEPEKG